jgi:predicted MFS family arabinose efflux permease
MVLSTSVGQVLPVLMSALKSDLHLSVAQAGLLASADLGAATITSVICARPAVRFSLATVARLGTVIIVAANLACLLARDFDGLFALRLVAGIGAGILTVACVVVLSQTPSPARSFALAALAQTAFGAAMSAAIPFLSARYGWDSSFVVIALLAVPGLLIARCYVRLEVPLTPSKQGSVKLIGRMVLLAITITFCGLGATWANLGELGARARLTLTAVGVAVALASFAGPITSLLVSALGSRVSSLIGLAVACGTVLGGVTLLSFANDVAILTLGAIVFMMGWTAYVPYAFGVTSSLDLTGTLSVLASATACAGFSLGPIMAVPVISRWGLGAVPGLTFGLILAGFCLVGPLVRKKAHLQLG